MKVEFKTRWNPAYCLTFYCTSGQCTCSLLVGLGNYNDSISTYICFFSSKMKNWRILAEGLKQNTYHITSVILIKGLTWVTQFHLHFWSLGDTVVKFSHIQKPKNEKTTIMKGSKNSGKKISQLVFQVWKIYVTLRKSAHQWEMNYLTVE